MHGEVSCVFAFSWVQLRGFASVGPRHHTLKGVKGQLQMSDPRRARHDGLLVQRRKAEPLQLAGGTPLEMRGQDWWQVLITDDGSDWVFVENYPINHLYF